MKEELATKPLTDLVSFVRGVSYTKGVERREPTPGYIRLLRANNIQGDLVFKDVIYVPQSCVKPDQILRNGDIVVAMSSGSKSVVGKTAQHWHAGEPTTFGAFCGVLRPNASVDPAFLGWFLRTEQYRQFISEISAGVNINNLKREYFEQVEVPNPSHAQQEATAQIIDALVTATSSPRDRLATIPALLKKFRQSVLAAACSGQLTADWREINDPKGALSSETLLVARVQQGTETKRKLVEVSKDIGVEYEVPTQWSIASTSCLCSDIVDCPHSTPKYGEGRFKAIDTNAITDSGIKVEKLRSLAEEAFNSRNRRLIPRGGDIVFAREGSVGNAVILPDSPRVCLGQRVMLLRPAEGISPGYLCIALTSPYTRAQYRDQILGTTVAHVNVGDVVRFALPVPSSEEQAEIVRRVESLFALADSIESRLAEATAQVERTTQAILTKAFRGEL